MNIVLDDAAEWAEFATWAASSSGVVATVAERDTWAVNERSLDGDLLRVLRRPSRECKRTDEEKEAAAAGIPVAVVEGLISGWEKYFNSKTCFPLPLFITIPWAMCQRNYSLTLQGIRIINSLHFIAERHSLRGPVYCP